MADVREAHNKTPLDSIVSPLVSLHSCSLRAVKPGSVDRESGRFPRYSPLCCFVSPSGLYAAPPFHRTADSVEERRCAQRAPLGDRRRSAALSRYAPGRALPPALGAAGPTPMHRRNFPAACLQPGASAVMFSLGPVVRPRPACPEFPHSPCPHRTPPEPPDGRIFSPTTWVSGAPPREPKISGVAHRIL
ncbi:hypothetical protein NDU88_003071 [Pleurodeles waltl]|uniref:Uncharacterized protein n=1 Tax=Pleurodeles waltl TaxID=8319 RepID=A0AAV7MCV3_PLEWA|nr:hypothetical protein NDU88_003071 [Pleurodeles waltl]